jgi:hypothetical protein
MVNQGGPESDVSWPPLSLEARPVKYFLPRTIPGFESGPAGFVEALRLVWNARGVVDILAVEHELSTLMGPNGAEPYRKNLERALRTLDR